MSASAKELRRLATKPGVAGAVLLVAMVDALGTESLQWDPETVADEWSRLLCDPLPPAAFNKLMAAVEVVSSDSFYRDLPAFVRLCNALTHGVFDPTEFDPADAGEVAWGITEALLLWPPDPDDEAPFSQEIVDYVRAAVREEGMMQPPDVLRLGLGPQDAGLWDEVSAEFSDDPQMFAAIAASERDKADEIDDMIRERLSSLIQDLDALPLENGEIELGANQVLSDLARREAG